MQRDAKMLSSILNITKGQKNEARKEKIFFALFFYFWSPFFFSDRLRPFVYLVIKPSSLLSFSFFLSFSLSFCCCCCCCCFTLLSLKEMFSELIAMWQGSQFGTSASSTFWYQLHQGIFLKIKTSSYSLRSASLQLITLTFFLFFCISIISISIFIIIIIQPHHHRHRIFLALCFWEKSVSHIVNVTQRNKNGYARRFILHHSVYLQTACLVGSAHAQT